MLVVTAAQARSSNNVWQLWCTFCQDLQTNLFLLDDSEPITLLQLFALLYCSGEMSASISPTKKCQVEQTLHAIGQMLASMGLPDPCLALFCSQLDFRLKCQLAGY